MYVDKDSLIINGLNMGKYVSEVEFGYNKLWGPESGRNLNGDNSPNTFIGIYPKLRLTFIPTTQEELETLAPILDSPVQNTTYYDPVLKSKTTISTYTGDWATSNKNTFSNVARANSSFNISVIANKKRVI